MFNNVQMKCCIAHAFQMTFWRAVLEKSKKISHNIVFVNVEFNKPVSHSSKFGKQRECQILKK